MVDVAVIGGGVVGSAVALELVRRGVEVVLLEGEPDVALGPSGTNSGILHTGFDSKPGELETRLILRSGELRDAVLERLEIPVLRCGAVLRARDGAERAAVEALAENARGNGVEVAMGEDGVMEVPGESVTDPVAYTLALAAAARALGAEVRTSAQVEAIERVDAGLELKIAGVRVRCRAAVNCAGLRADEVARMAGDDSFEIYPRKGEFFVFDAPEPLERIMLPVPSEGTKGVLVFPTLDGHVVAGPTAYDQDDKADWSVRPEALEEVMGKASAMLPQLDGLEPVASYAGLRPAGRGSNYLIEPSAACPRLVNAAAIRSTGLTASLGIAEHVAGLVAAAGVEQAAEAPAEFPAAAPPEARETPWWRRSALHWGAA